MDLSNKIDVPSSGQNRIEVCPHCGEMYIDEMIPFHLQTAHGFPANTSNGEIRKVWKQKFKMRFPDENEIRLSKELKERKRKRGLAKKQKLRKEKEKKTRIQHEKATPLVQLEDSFGLKLNELKTCSACGEKKKPVWTYRYSNMGPVNICLKCKPQVFRDSFGQKDVLDYALRGGAFESNRRRH